MTKRKGGSGTYDVGYGKPPRDTQFRPGHSGNPRGRPRGRPSFRSLLEKRLYQTTRVSIGGELQNMVVLDAAATRLVQTLLRGTTGNAIAAARLILPLLISEHEEPIPYDLSQLTDEELNLLADLQAKIFAGDKGHDRKG